MNRPTEKLPDTFKGSLRRPCWLAASLLPAALALAIGGGAIPLFLEPLVFGPRLANAQDDDSGEDGGGDPRFVERVIDFMWTEQGALWSDTFRARLYPRSPTVGRSARVSLRIKRRKDGRGRSGVDPIKVEAVIRKADGGGQIVLSKDNPGRSVSFEHEFDHPGRWIVSLKTYYSEEETYTIALRCSVQNPPPREEESEEADAPPP